MEDQTTRTRITYPLRFALELSPVGRAFVWVHIDEDVDYYYEVDTGAQVIRLSVFTCHEAYDMRGESLVAYNDALQARGVPLDHGWRPLMRRLSEE